MSKQKEKEKVEELAEMEAIGKTKYAVAVQLGATEFYTIWATSPQEAGELVMKGNGRPAGREGPFLVNVAAKDHSLTKKDNLEDIKGSKRIVPATAIEVVKE